MKGKMLKSGISNLFVSMLLFGVGLGVSFAGNTGQDLTTYSTNLSTQISSATDIMSYIAYIVGLGIGFKGALKLKEHNESQGKVPLSQPITLFIVAGLLFALPTIVGISKNTISTGDTNQSATLGGQGFRAVN
jgi:hypothetical protein